MGCADHRLCGVCHPYRPGGYVLHGNVGKGKKVKRVILRLLPWRSLAVYAFSLENVWADGFFYVSLHAEIEIINF